MTRSARLLLVVFALAASPSCQPAAYVGDAIPAAAGEGMAAFEGAEKFGCNATGWRGGAVIKVTNLNDHGPGSLRAGAEGSRPPVCICEVAGTIEVIEVGTNVYLAGRAAGRP